MRVLVAMFALFPILASAQDLGTYRITSGTVVSESGEVSGNGFTGGGLFAAPELLAEPEESLFRGGAPQLSFCFGCGLPGPDDGVGVLSVTRLNNPALAGLVQVMGPEGLLETGELTVAPTIDVTGAGIYRAPFTMSADLALGRSRMGTPTEYANFVGNGTVTLDLGPARCPNGPGQLCGPMQIESLVYTFTPELDPAALSGALTLLGGGLLVLLGRRSHA
jgi:hypothetical protein